MQLFFLSLTVSWTVSELSVNETLKFIKLIKRSETHSYCTGQSNQLNHPQCRTSAAQRAFPFRAYKIKYWSSLSNDIRNSASVEAFKRSAGLEIMRMRK